MKALIDAIIERFEADTTASGGLPLYLDSAPDMTQIPMNLIGAIDTEPIIRPFDGDRADEVVLRIDIFRLDPSDCVDAQRATIDLFDEVRFDLDHDTMMACLVTGGYGPMTEGKYKDGASTVVHAGVEITATIDRTGSDS